MLESTIEMIRLIAYMVFISSIGAQVWIAFLDIANFFTKQLEKYRPQPSQDKYSRIAIIIGVLILLKN